MKYLFGIVVVISVAFMLVFDKNPQALEEIFNTSVREIANHVFELESETARKKYAQEDLDIMATSFDAKVTGAFGLMLGYYYTKKSACDPRQDPKLEFIQAGEPSSFCKITPALRHDLFSDYKIGLIPGSNQAYAILGWAYIKGVYTDSKEGLKDSAESCSAQIDMFEVLMKRRYFSAVVKGNPFRTKRIVNTGYLLEYQTANKRIAFGCRSVYYKPFFEKRVVKPQIIILYEDLKLVKEANMIFNQVTQKRVVELQRGL